MNALYDAAVVFSLNSTINAAELESILIQKHGGFYASIYRLEVHVCDDDECMAHIKDNLRSMHSRNESQGKGGLYTGYADRPYSTIWNIIERRNMTISDSDIQEIVSTVIGTLEAERQTVSDKNFGGWLAY